MAFGVHLNSRILCQGIIGLVCALYLIAQPLICSQMCTLSPPQSRVSDMIGTSSEAHSCMRSHHLMTLQSSRDGPCPCNTWTRLKSILLTSKCHCFDIPCRYSSSIGSQKTSCHSWLELCPSYLRRNFRTALVFQTKGSFGPHFKDSQDVSKTPAAGHSTSCLSTSTSSMKMAISYKWDI